jgi:hypothetical protein
MRHLASRPRRVSAMLLRTEGLRTAVRAVLSPQRMLLVRALLDGVSFITAGVTLSDEAGILRPPELRSLDPIGRFRGTGRFEWTTGGSERAAGCRLVEAGPRLWRKCANCTKIALSGALERAFRRRMVYLGVSGDPTGAGMKHKADLGIPARVRLAPPSSRPLRSESAARARCRRLCTRRCIPAQPQLVRPPASA